MKGHFRDGEWSADGESQSVREKKQNKRNSFSTERGHKVVFVY